MPEENETKDIREYGVEEGYWGLKQARSRRLHDLNSSSSSSIIRVVETSASRMKENRNGDRVLLQN